jgi:hypothetical protein
MLASTVQFSRNGQHHRPRPRTSEDRPRPVLKTRAKPASSGPNSVPTRGPPRLPRSPPRKERVLAGRKKRPQVNSQCSTRKHGRPARHSLTSGAFAP